MDCVITSPPYYELRDYGVAGQLGAELSIEGWVDGLRVVAREVARVLKPSGAFWLNLGDSFSRHVRYGAAPKALLLGPERLLLALSGDGWLVRNKVVWAKTNPMPSQVRDRLTLTWEVFYLLVRSPRYYFDLDAIREPHISPIPTPKRLPMAETAGWAGPLAASRGGLAKAKSAGRVGHPLGKNPGDVWRIATRGYQGLHFATFPAELVRRPILATCPAHWSVATAASRGVSSVTAVWDRPDRAATSRPRRGREWCSTRSLAAEPSDSPPVNCGATGSASRSTRTTSSSHASASGST